jgi:hypothetical protein
MNGKNSWFAEIYIENYRCYLGTYKSELRAAKIQDVVQIQCNGLGAKLNFDYSKAEILAILEERSIVAKRKEVD